MGIYDGLVAVGSAPECTE